MLGEVGTGERGQSVMRVAGRGWLKWAAVTVVVGFVTFLTGPHAPLGGFWGLEAGAGPQPVGVQAPLLILLSAIESVATGFGFAFLIYGSPMIAATGVSPG